MSFTGRDGVGSVQQIAAQNDGTILPFVFTHTRAAATPTPLTAVVASAQAIAAAVGLKLIGYTVQETAGAIAAISVYHGTNNAGVLMSAPLALEPNQRVTEWFGSGVACPNGVWLQRGSGTFTIVFYSEAG